MRLPLNNYLLFCIYALTPFLLIDMVNGALMMSGRNLPVSSVYKIVLMFLFFVPSVKSGNLLIVISWVLGTVLYQTSQYSGSFIFDFGAMAKSLTFLVMFYCFYVNRNLLDSRHFKAIKTVIAINFFVLVLNIFVGILGFGYSTYGSFPVNSGSGLGYKGYFFAGNEVGALLICMLPLIYHSYFDESYWFQLCLFVFTSLIASVLLSTKTAILGTFIFGIFVLFSRYRAKAVVIVALLSFLSFVYLYDIIYQSLELLIDRLTFFIETRGLYYIVLSGRDEFLSSIFNIIYNDFDILDIVFGVGASYYSILTKSAEIDFIDIFFSHGIVWLLVVYFSIFIYCILVVPLSIKSNKSGFIVTLFLLFFISIFAGHTLTSAMMLPFFSLYYPFVLMSKNQ